MPTDKDLDNELVNEFGKEVAEGYHIIETEDKDGKGAIVKTYDVICDGSTIFTSPMKNAAFAFVAGHKAGSEYEGKPKPKPKGNDVNAGEDDTSGNDGDKGKQSLTPSKPASKPRRMI